MPTQGGLVNPAEEVGAVAREAGVPFLLDACQSVGQLPIDVERIGCDLLSATGPQVPARSTRHRLPLRATRLLDRWSRRFSTCTPRRGPRRTSYEIRPDARRFESWETNYAGKIGLGVAVDYALSWGLDAIETRVTALAESLRERLAALDGVHVHDLGQRRCAIVTFTVDGVPAQAVQRRLASRGVNTSVSLASSARLDLPRRGLSELVRASVHYYNTDEELDRLVDALPRPTARAG